MNVLIIPEDFRNDQYILKPIFSQLVGTFNRPSIHIQICRSPLLGGVGEALKSDCIAEIVAKYRGMIDIFILCVDRDGVVGRRHRLDQLEAEFAGSGPLLAENAREELETWVLAGINLPSQWRWAAVRAEVDVKERYFEPLAAQRGSGRFPWRRTQGRWERKRRAVSWMPSGKSARRTLIPWLDGWNSPSKTSRTR